MDNNILMDIEAFKEAETYWLDKLSGISSEVRLAGDFPRTNQYERANLQRKFGQMLTKRLMQIGKDNDLSIYIILLTALKITLFQYTRQNEIVVASPIYSKSSREYNDLVVFNDFVHSEMTFKELLAEVKETVVSGYKNEHYSIEKAIKILKLEDNISLFRIIVLMESIHEKALVQDREDEPGSDMIFFIRNHSEELAAEITYNAKLFRQESIQNFFDVYFRILKQVLEATGVRIADLELMPEDEKRRILGECNQARVDCTGEKTIQQLFEEQVKRTPNNTAVKFSIDLKDIYDALASGEMNADICQEMERGCFQKNPYLFVTDVNIAGVSGSFCLVKTHRHNSVVVNAGLLQLMDLFDGQQNLRSIFTALEERDLKFVIYSIEEKDALEIAFRFNPEAEIFNTREFESLAALVQALYRKNLLDLTGVNPGGHVPGDRARQVFSQDADKENLDFPRQLLAKGGVLPKAEVLLMGDTPGISTTGLLYLASYLWRKGIKVQCQFYDPAEDYHSMRSNIETLLDEVQPRIVGISLKWFLYVARVLDIGRIVKEHSPHVKVVVGGDTASYYREEIIARDAIDCVVCGDGEVPFYKICRGEPLEETPNCVYKKEGEVVSTPFSYVQDELNSTDIYLSHLHEVMIPTFAPILVNLFIYTHKGCEGSCIHCGGGQEMQEKNFNRTKPSRRRVEEVRKDIIEAKEYTATLMFAFNVPDNELLGYCEKIWEGIDLCSHFCIISVRTPPSDGLLELVNRTFKYTYWHLEIFSLSQRHRDQLVSQGLLRPQPSDEEILAFLERCGKFDNNEVKIDATAGLPHFVYGDIKSSEQLLSAVMKNHAVNGLYWKRLQAQPGAPVAENAASYGMHSYAKTFADFQRHSDRGFNRDLPYRGLDSFNYAHVYFKDNQLNADISRHFARVNMEFLKTQKTRRKKLMVDKNLSYRQLNLKANQLARLLRKKGIQANSIVGVVIETSIEQLIAILGILKAGGAYLPIARETPGKRVVNILNDVNISILLTKAGIFEEKLRHLVGHESTLCIIDESADLLVGESGQDLEPINRCTDLAYVIFTSGSTGNPKGVGVEHRGVVNMLLFRKEVYKIDSGVTTLQLFPYAFDGFVASFFTPIISGATVIFLNEAEFIDMTKLREIIVRNRVSHFISIPEFFKLLLENLTEEEAAPLKVVTLAGSKLPSKVLTAAYRRYKDLEIVNEYGVTESSVLSTIYRHQERDPHVKVGRPIANTRVCVFNQQNRLNPPGVPGELGTAGMGVTRGYLNNVELTAEKFVIHPPRSGERWYRTGDLARWLPDGNIELLGRIDHQVKIRGFRIETGEIERKLSEHGAIKDAVVTAVKDEAGNENLAAYYVEQATAANRPELWPSVSEFFVYDDLLYHAMTNDELRNVRYKAAIKKFVKDKVVIDVGTGKDAILARFCAEAGAKKVYAVEMIKEAFTQAEQSIQEFDPGGKIVLIHGDAMTVRLPEKADVCVSEIVGPIGGSEGAAVILNHVRRLLKEDGVMIPEISVTKIAAVCLPDDIHRGPGFTQIPAEYTEKIFNSLGYRFDLRVCIKSFPQENVISNAGEFEYLNFSTEVDTESSIDITLVINQDSSRLDGFLAWLNLHTVKNEIIDILKHEHCWLPVFIPVFYPGVPVSIGDTIKAECQRTLSENGVNSDYKIKGVLIRENRQNIEFEYDLPHFERSYKKSPFYQKLFSNGLLNRAEKGYRKIAADELKSYLSKELPVYMIPTYFIPLDKMPLTLSGKVDRHSLPDPKINLNSEYVEPRSGREKTISTIWKEVLRLDKVGIHDNFFDLGGNSMNIVEVNSKLKAHFERDISVSTMFRYPTIHALAKYISPDETGGDERVLDNNRLKTLQSAKAGKKRRLQIRKREL